MALYDKLKEHQEELEQTYVDLALGNPVEGEVDTKILREAISVLSKQQQQIINVNFRLDEMHSTRDLVNASALIIRGVTEGTIPYSDGKRILDLLDMHKTLMESVLIEDMMDQLRAEHAKYIQDRPKPVAGEQRALIEEGGDRCVESVSNKRNKIHVG